MPDNAHLFHDHQIDSEHSIRVSRYAEHAHIESYAFDPQPDITTWELAQCLALIQRTSLAGDGLADVMRRKGIERHFVSMTL